MQAVFTISMEPAWLMELESDAPHKFSRHIIINIPGKAFANNLQAGCFVNKVCQAAIDPVTGMSSLRVAKVRLVTTMFRPLHQLVQWLQSYTCLQQPSAW